MHNDWDHTTESEMWNVYLSTTSLRTSNFTLRKAESTLSRPITVA